MPPDVEKAVGHFIRFLKALDVDVEDSHIDGTPDRIVDWYLEFLDPPPIGFSIFPNEEDLDEIILCKDIPVYSLCAHHFLPFFGVAHVAYIPKRKLAGLSKLARAVEWYARRFTIQERVTVQVANFLEAQLDPQGVAVVLECEHLCMSMRGACKPGHRTVTSRMRGMFLHSAEARNEFLQLIRGKA